jgi:hypothetical protein
MSTVRPMAHTLASRGVGLLVGIGAVSPAFAAGLDSTLPPRELLLSAALVLLSVALAMRLIRRREKQGTEPDAPDLRWWKNSNA